MGEAAPGDQVSDTVETLQGGLENASEMEVAMDELSNHESHRTRGGRDLEITS